MTGRTNANAQGDRDNIKYISWNVKGVNNPVKRKRVLTHLKGLNANFAFLQETHLRTSDHFRIRKDWVGQLFHSNFHHKSRGAAILVNKSTPFIASDVITDPKGRYVIVTGKLFSTPLVLANLYAPNWDDTNFISTFLSAIPNLDSHSLILGGDFNLVMSPALDRSSQRVTGPSKCASLIQMFLQKYGLCDAWRFLHPSARQYSFFSHVHHTFSRIDYFFMDKKLLPNLQDSSYESIVISDHAPLVLKLKFPQLPPRSYQWRLNSLLLSDKTFIQMMSTEIPLFLEINTTPGMSYSTIWESLKAYLRGKSIAYGASVNKARTQRLCDISNLMATLDGRYATDPSPDLYKQRLLLQSEYDNLSTVHAERLLQQARYRIYEQGDKTSKLLAHQIRKSEAARIIPQIRTNSGATTVVHEEINNRFKQFYTSLYTSESSQDPQVINSFFNGLNIPSISKDSQDSLEQEFSSEEIEVAISSMKSGKAAGPDGFPNEFYKAFSKQLSPFLSLLFAECQENSTLPPTFYQASISLLLKKDKDPLEPGSYRAISLLNSDYKILTKLLAQRMEGPLQVVIHSDQTGFISNRHSFFNIRQLLNVLYSPASKDPEVVVSFDAEKAFDRVEWDYLINALPRFGFGPKFVIWIKTLYSSPMASVRSNNISSEYFPLQRGTRQGCPLSPILFALAVEPLAIALRANNGIQGIPRGTLNLKLSLYADDLLLFISNPNVSLPKALSVMEAFGKVSGYKLNIGKSELFPINNAALNGSFSHFQFRVVQDQFTYLGVKVTRKYSDLFKANIAALVDRLKQSFTYWRSLPLSLIGRVNVIKMNVLPKFLYFFQCLPVFIPTSFFTLIERTFLSFIWDGKVPRIGKKHLQKSKDLGGLALPNFQSYYWAANFRGLLHWIPPDQGQVIPFWAQLEWESCKPATLSSLLCCSLPFPLKKCGDNPVVKQSLRIWNQFRLAFNLKHLSLSGPISKNILFPPSLNDGAFQIWHTSGLTSLSQLYIDGTFASFTQLKEKFKLPASQFFRYLQMRDFVRKRTLGFPNMPTGTPVEDILHFNTVSKGVTSFIYGIINNLSNPPAPFKTLWERDLGEEFDEDTWSSILNRIHSSSFSARHCLIQFKVVHRIHWSRAKIGKIFPNTDPTCPRCKLEPATLFHQFWSCPKLSDFWGSIFKCFSEIFDFDFEPCPLTAIFGILPVGCPLSRAQSDTVAYATLLARRVILLNWKLTFLPSYNHWVRDLLGCLRLEKLKFSSRGKPECFYRAWLPFMTYFERITL